VIFTLSKKLTTPLRQKESQDSLISKS
jgi:hypothetical protein